MNAEQLKELRLKLGLTQKQMAAKLHMSRSTYLRFEHGTWPLKWPLTAGVEKVEVLLIET